MSHQYCTLRRNGQVIERSRRGNRSPGKPFNSNPCTNFITRRRCFRCDWFMFSIGRRIAVHCVEGTVVEISICRRCARKTPAPMQQRAPLSIGSEVTA